MSPPPWMVFADDWGRHPSSCQHLVRHVLPHRQVVWVNTIGTRPPRLDWGTVKRAAGKIKGWIAGPVSREPTASATEAAPTVLSPKMWPSFRSTFGRRLNRKLLLHALTPVVAGLPSPPVVVTTLPLVADLIGELPAARWVYYCVDDFSVWPGYDGETMLRMEKELVPKVDAAVAVSETLKAKLAAMGRESLLLTHGVDLDHWKAAIEPTGVRGMWREGEPRPPLPAGERSVSAKHEPGEGSNTPQHPSPAALAPLGPGTIPHATGPGEVDVVGTTAQGIPPSNLQTKSSSLPPEFAGLEPPIILFWGVIDRRMDVAFVRHLCEHLDRGTVVLVGPQEDPDPVLKTLPRLAIRPPVAFARLPVLAQATAVLLMPYADLPATRAMQPLKLKEYLATGRPAVVRALPSTTEWADAADVCGTPAEFTAAVRQRCVSGLPAGQGQARERLTAEGWAAKAETFAEWVDGVKFG